LESGKRKQRAADSTRNHGSESLEVAENPQSHSARMATQAPG